MKTASKSSFTLFELLVVILIISIIYAVFVERLKSKEHQIGSKGIEAIDTLLEGYEFDKYAEIICTNRCKTCAIYLDGNKTTSIDSPFLKEPKVYDYDIHGLLSKLHFTPIFDEHGNPKEVCFRYTLYPNKSHSSYIVEHDGQFYVFYAYNRSITKAESLQQAGELLDPSKWIPTDIGEYNF